MKYIKKFAAFLLPLLLLVGCQGTGIDKDTVIRSREGKEFTAGLEGTIPTDEETKTFVDKDLNMYWTSDDRLSIFISTINVQYRFDGETGDKTGSFSMVNSGQFVSGNTISTNYGVYPYNAATSIDNDEKISIVLPDTQYYTANSFGLGANTMVAVTGSRDDYFLPFKNVCGYLVVRLYGEGAVKRIKIEGNNGEKISGAATVTASHTTDPVLAMAGTATGSITLDCGEGITVGATAETATEFWIVMPPVTFTQGFTVTIEDDNNGHMVKKTTASRTVQRNILTRMAPLQMVTSEPGEGTALLPPGQDFITAIKQLADPDAVYNTDVFITRISLNVNNPSTEGVVVSDLFSEVPIYAVYDDVTGHLDINTAAAEICTGEDASYLFSYLFQCEAIDNLSVLNTSAATTMFSMFNNYTDDSLTNEKICMTSLDVTGLNTENVTVFTNMFNNCRKLTNLDLSSFNTSNATNMQYMFSRCVSLESLDLSSFDTQNVTNFNYFLNHCESLTSLNISTLNTSSATTMQYMFQYCVSLPYVDLSSIDVTAVEGPGLQYMFSHCESMKTIDVNHFNLENATSLAYFMAYMYGLESLNLSGLDTYNITNMSNIFYGQKSRTSIKLGGKFTTENCTTLAYMFYDNDAMVEFNADDLDTSNCTNLNYLFHGCDVLQKIDLSAMDLASASSINHMFERDPNLTEIRVGENFVHSKKPTNFFCNSIQGPGERTASNPGVLTIYCDQDQADWLATTLLRYMYWGYYGETTSTAVIDGCPRITINFKDRDTGADIGVDWPTPSGETYYPVTSVSLSSASISLAEGGSHQLKATVLPSNATNKSVSWASGDTLIATVSSEGVVTAVSPGTATITATTHDGGYTATCTVTVTEEIVVPDMIDLGLSVKWGSFNLGTDSPEGYGCYYAWGETEPKSSYYWSTYKYCNGSGHTLTKYCNDSSYGYNGFTDNKTVLDLSDDAARVKLGGSWRMPTDAEWTELREQCTWTWTTQNGVNGYKITSKTNGNSIFLPAAGDRVDTGLSYVDSYGYYLSSTLRTGTPYNAWDVSFSSSSIYRYYGNRCTGRSIRPVYGDCIPVESVSLSNSSLSLAEEGTYPLVATIQPANAWNTSVNWTSNNTSVATVTSTGVVTAVSPGTATITATTHDGGYTATCTVTVIEIVAPDMVDLGLSVKWGSFNLGAVSPEGYGGYYAWGETRAKSNYNESTYKYYFGNYITLTKYCNDSSYGYNGFTDNKTVLDLSDDAARVKLGGSWRMPTDAEWTELREQCTWTWTTQNGVNGYKITSKTNGNSIFLPAAGYRDNFSFTNVGSFGNYWSSTLNTVYPTHAWLVKFNSSNIYRISDLRFLGQSIRPVLAN